MRYGAVTITPFKEIPLLLSAPPTTSLCSILEQSFANTLQTELFLSNSELRFFFLFLGKLGLLTKTSMTNPTGNICKLSRTLVFAIVTEFVLFSRGIDADRDKLAQSGGKIAHFLSRILEVYFAYHHEAYSMRGLISFFLKEITVISNKRNSLILLVIYTICMYVCRSIPS